MSGEAGEPDPEQPPLVGSSSDDDEAYDLKSKEGRKKRGRNRRLRIESPQYQEFAARMLKDRKRHRWATGFSIFYIVVEVIADIIMIACLVQLHLSNSLIWTSSGLIVGTIAYFSGNVVILISGSLIIYYINRKQGLINARGKLYFNCLCVLIGTILELIMMVPFMLKGSHSLTYNQNHDDCIKHLDEDLSLDIEWTFDQEEQVCASYRHVNWSIIKATLATTFCGQIIWLIVLFEFSCLVIAFYQPSPEIWKTYRRYRKTPIEIERKPRRWEHNPVGNSTSAYSIGSHKLSPMNIKAPSSRNLVVPSSSGTSERHSANRKTMDYLAIIT